MRTTLQAGRGRFDDAGTIPRPFRLSRRSEVKFVNAYAAAGNSPAAVFISLNQSGTTHFFRHLTMEMARQQQPRQVELCSLSDSELPRRHIATPSVKAGTRCKNPRPSPARAAVARHSQKSALRRQRHRHPPPGAGTDFRSVQFDARCTPRPFRQTRARARC